MSTLKVGEPHATAKYLPSRESSIAKISRGQIPRIEKLRDDY